MMNKVLLFFSLIILCVSNVQARMDWEGEYFLNSGVRVVRRHEHVILDARGTQFDQGGIRLDGGILRSSGIRFNNGVQLLPQMDEPQFRQQVQQLGLIQSSQVRTGTIGKHCRKGKPAASSKVRCNKSKRCSSRKHVNPKLVTISVSRVQTRKHPRL